MNHRISAGARVENNGRLLLVRHRKQAAYDFWVAPGGGVQGAESLLAAAEREIREETGLVVVAELTFPLLPYQSEVEGVRQPGEWRA